MTDEAKDAPETDAMINPDALTQPEDVVPMPARQPDIVDLIRQDLMSLDDRIAKMGSRVRALEEFQSWAVGVWEGVERTAKRWRPW